MRFPLVSIVFSLTLIGCASTKTKQGADIRPVEKTQQAAFDFETLKEQAGKHFERGEYAQALQNYRDILLNLSRDDAKRDDILLAYGESALGLSQKNAQYLDEARLAFEQLDAKDDLTKDLTNRLVAGQALLALADNHKDSEALLIRALKHNPDDLRLRNALGHLYDGRQSWLEALDVYVGALAVANATGDETAAIVNNIGMSLLMQGRTKEALEKFEQAAQKAPTQDVFDNNRRMALTLLGQSTQAFENLEDPLAAQLFNDVGYIAASRGDTAKARGYYKKAIALSPHYFERAELNLAALDAG